MYWAYRGEAGIRAMPPGNGISHLTSGHLKEDRTVTFQLAAAEPGGGLGTVG